MRALITGVTGFAGRFLAKNLLNNGYEVYGATRNSCPALLEYGIQPIVFDYANEADMISSLDKISPDEIYHLAAQSSVKSSWDDKIETFEINALLSMRLMEALRKSRVSQSAKLLMVGSSEEYGWIEDPSLAISEDTDLNPISPYGVSKAASYLLHRHYVRVYGLKSIYARPFNHIGPGQKEGFVASDFAKQIVMIEKGMSPPVIEVGNVKSVRDFTDVRDIVTAYQMLASKGKTGDVYNICSGAPISIEEVLFTLLELSQVGNIKVNYDEKRMRPSDFPVYIGDSSKIEKSLGWRCAYTLRSSLQSVLEDWRTRL